MRDNQIKIIIDIKNKTKTYDIVATKTKQQVEVSNMRGTVEVSKMTRTGVIVRNGRFMATRIMAIIKYPTLDEQMEQKPRQTRNQNSLL